MMNTNTLVSPLLRLGRRQPDIVRQLKCCLWVALEGLKVHDQVVLDREDRIVGEVLALPVENLGRQGAVGVLADLFLCVSLLPESDA